MSNGGLTTIASDNALGAGRTYGCTCSVYGTLARLRTLKVVRESVGPTGIVVGNGGRTILVSLGVTHSISRDSSGSATSLNAINCTTPRRCKVSRSNGSASVCTLNILLGVVVANIRPTVGSPGKPVGRVVRGTAGIRVSQECRDTGRVRGRLELCV